MITVHQRGKNAKNAGLQEFPDFHKRQITIEKKQKLSLIIHLAISSLAIQMIASDCSCDAVVHSVLGLSFRRESFTRGSFLAGHPGVTRADVQGQKLRPGPLNLA